ncbi:MAG TPA: DinB family protein [Tepidisphaeraceae bacterium]
MMDAFTVELLWRYMVHADDQMLAAAQSVGDEGYFREQNISLGSVHKLLVHCMDAQRIWLSRLNDLENPPILDANAVARESLKALWAEQHEQMLAFARDQTADSLKTVMRFRTRKGDPFEMTRGAVMLHVSDHATYHRGQLNSMIKLAGGRPSDVMLYSWSLAEGFGRVGWGE